MTKTYDFCIIGGGHNGLTAAAYAARSGKKTIILEALPRIGGFCTTSNYAPDAPNVKISPHALDHVLVKVEPSIITELDLENYGLEYYEVDPFGGYVASDGTQVAFRRDVGATCRSIAEFSPNDAKNYRAFVERGQTLWSLMLPYMMGHPIRPTLSTIGKTLAAAWRGRKNLMGAGRIAMRSGAALIEETFEHPYMKAALANLGASAGLPLNAPASGLLCAVLALQHEHGVYRPKGGSGALPMALEKFVVAHNGEIRTNASVTRLRAEDDSVAVTIGDNETISAKKVIAAIEPRTFAEKIIGLECLPEKTKKELRGLRQNANNIAMGSISLVLNGRPKLAGRSNNDELLGASIYVAESFESVQAAVLSAQTGKLPDPLPVWMVTPSVLDDTLVPNDQEKHVIYGYLPVLPFKRTETMKSEGEYRQEIKGRALTALESIAPGITDQVDTAIVHTPADLEGWSYGNAYGPYHADLSFDQLGPWRPFPSFAGYKTPLKNVYHSGAGAHPLGTINGWSGRSAAKLALRH
jgi:beta-carotene ketolase (CrtO type)